MSVKNFRESDAHIEQAQTLNCALYGPIQKNGV